MVFEDILKEAAKRDQIIDVYLQGKYKTKESFKVRPVLEALVNHEHIKRISHKPTVLNWV